jgi:predicted PurR-regulated permease PerM
MVPDQQPASRKTRTYQWLQAKKFSRIYLLIVMVFAGVLFFNVIKIFVVPILLAAVFTSLFFPLYEWFNRRVFKTSKSASSLLTCTTLLICLIVPVYIIGDLVSSEAAQLFSDAVPKVREILEKGDEGLLGDLKNLPVLRNLDWDNIEWQSSVKDIATNAASIFTTILNKTYQGTFTLITNLFVTLFTMFYFFRDGDRLIERIKYLSPLDDIYEEGLIHRFSTVSRATIVGTAVIGLIQGTTGGLVLWICGVSSPILWSVVMVVLAVIPLIGAWLVLYPAAIIELILGNIWQGVFIAVVTVVVISNIDNLLRPILVGRTAKMHDLITFFSTLGGISLFGIMGFIIGPVIAVLFLTILDIYSIEFKSTLDLAQSTDLIEGTDSG